MKDLFETEKRAISLEIGESFIKLAETQIIKGRRQVVRLMKKELSSKEDSAISEDIKRLLESLNIIQPKVHLNVPRHLVTIRFLKLPSTDDEEIKKIIKTESLKHLPYTDEDILYGYRIVEKQEDGYSNVLLAIAQAAIVKRLITILKAAEADTGLISLGAEVLFLWYSLAKESEGKEDVMLVNINSEYIDMDVIEDGKLTFTRGVRYDKEDSSASEKIIDQIKISIATHQKKSAKSINKIILSGTRDKVRKCEDSLKGKSEIPVEVIDQMENIPIGENADIDLKETSFVELLGLSLKSEDVKINLVPEDILKEARLKLSKKSLIVTLTLTVLIMLAGSCLVMKKLHDKEIYLSYINRELNKMEPQVTRAKKMMKDINVIGEETGKKPLAIDILNEVYKATTPGISLNMLDFESNKSLTIRGNAPALSDVFKYVTMLEGSPFFKSVKVKYATKRVTEDRELADFEINCLLSQIKY